MRGVWGWGVANRWALYSQPFKTSGPDFYRLLLIRWLGQFADGLLQSSLASYILFSPEKQSTALAAAASFAVTLLPYSLIAPLTGTFLDRYDRVKVLTICNLLRAISLLGIIFVIATQASNLLLIIFVLIPFGLNRLILAGLSAGLPMVTTQENLITLNAISATGGTILILVGGGFGILIKTLLDNVFSGSIANVLIVALAGAIYLIVSIISMRWGAGKIGPTEILSNQSENLVTLSIANEGVVASNIKSHNVSFTQLKDGFNFIKQHPDLLRAVSSTALTRFGQTALVVMGLLLERNTFNSATNPEKGLQSFGQALAIAGIGIVFGAFIAPYLVIIFGRHNLIRYAIFAAIPNLIFFSFFIKPWSLILSAFCLGAVGQAVKVTADALLQSKTIDIFRGRVFAFYDVVVNSSLVLGAFLGALLLPTSGISKTMPLTLALIYLFYVSIVLNKKKFHG